MEHHGGEMAPVALQKDFLVVSQNLEALRLEYGEQLNYSSEGKREQILNDMKKIQLGLADAEMMLYLSKYSEVIEVEKQNLESEVSRLSQQNRKLQFELSDIQRKLENSEEKISLHVDNKRKIESKRHCNLKNKRKALGSSLKMEDPVIDLMPAVEDLNRIHEWAGPWYSSLLNDCPLTPNLLDFNFYLRTIHKIVLQYASQGRYEVAVPLCKQAIEELKSTCGHNSPDVADKMVILAFIYRDQNRYQEAVKLLVDALAIRQSTLEMDVKSIITVLDNLSHLYYKMGKYEEMEPLYKQKLEICTKKFGPCHRHVVKALNKLGFISHKLRKYEDAEEYSQQVLEILGVNHDPDDNEVIRAKRMITLCELRRKNRRRWEEAVKKKLNHLGVSRTFSEEKKICLG